MRNSNFHNWLFSEKYGFETNQYIENNLEISDSRFVELLTEEYYSNLDLISTVESDMLVVGFAKASYVSSAHTGRSLGSIICSMGIADDLLCQFIESHKGVFEGVWRNNERHKLDSFQIYWDNIFMYGDIELGRFILGQSKTALKFREVIGFFCESPPHKAILETIGFVNHTFPNHTFPDK